jgi:hypothetical protein
MINGKQRLIGSQSCGCQNTYGVGDLELRAKRQIAINGLRTRKPVWSEEARQAASKRAKNAWADGTMRQYQNMVESRHRDIPWEGFTDEDVLSVRADPRILKEIAADWNVSLNMIWNIKNHLAYAHVKGPPSVPSEGSPRVFTLEEIETICADTRSNRTIAKDYNVVHGTIVRIKRAHGVVVPPRVRSVATPKGTFENLLKAAEENKVSHATAQRYASQNRYGWSYVDSYEHKPTILVDLKTVQS